MPSVTQLVPNFLGGVSRQNDDKKLEGQLTDCVNGYPDPTYGLLKRPGMQFTNVLKKSNGTAFTESELEDAVWFFIERDAEGSYIGAIKGTNIYVWKASDGTWCTVTNNASSYLSGTNYHFRSIQDTTIITNRGTTTAMQAAGSFTANSVATIKLVTLIDGYNYSITIQGDTVTTAAQSTTTFDDMLLYDSSSTNTNHHLVDALVAHLEARQTANDTDYDGTWCIEGYGNSLVIKRFDTTTDQVLTDYQHADGTFTDDGTPLAFSISARGGLSNDAIEAFTDEIVTVAKLPNESFHGHQVEILNSDGPEDNYHVIYEAYNSQRGRGYWKETVARDVSSGLNASTMPHELVNTGDTTFTFGQITWLPRAAGDDVTSPVPAFIGNTINCTFFYNDRLGILSADNINFSVANDAYNFFVKSALTEVDSDPIDLNVSSIRPVTLSDVLPSPQGLIVFSERQQFQIFTTDGSTLTPNSAVVRSISNYEMNTNISPVDVGTTAAFVNSVPGYSKLFTLQLRDIEQNPIVVDISKVVLEWIPEGVDGLTVSPQNSVIMLIDRGTSYLYLYRYYNNGEKDLFQAWTKWQLPGTIQTAKIINDAVIVISQHEDEYTLGRITLDEIPTGDVVATANDILGNSCLDMATRPVSPDPGTVDAVVYDSTNDLTKIYVPYTPFEQTEAVMLLAVPTADDGTDAEIDADAGYYATAYERTESGTNYRYFEVKGNFTNYADGIIVGYGYDLEATLPKFYYRRNPTTTDFTAALTISRVVFSIGRTGAVKFKLRPTGRKEWIDVQHTAIADYYAGDSSPVVSERQFTVPIHQRNTNFELKVTSNLPYPVSLVSMMWEGNYSPRFYRRA
jgi:hypothetical protein